MRIVLDGQPEPPRYFARDEAHQQGGAARARRPAATAAPAGQRASEAARDRRDASWTRGRARRSRRGTCRARSTSRSMHELHDLGGLAAAVRPRRSSARGRRRLPALRRDRGAGAGDDRPGPRGGLLGAEALAAWRRPAASWRRCADHGGGGGGDARVGATPCSTCAARRSGRRATCPARRTSRSAMLAERIDELPAQPAVVVQCQAGARSAIAASVLEAHGVTNVVNMTWRLRGLAAGRAPVRRQPDDESDAAGRRDRGIRRSSMFARRQSKYLDHEWSTSLPRACHGEQASDPRDDRARRRALPRRSAEPARLHIMKALRGGRTDGGRAGGGDGARHGERLEASAAPARRRAS